MSAPFTGVFDPASDKTVGLHRRIEQTLLGDPEFARAVLGGQGFCPYLYEDDEDDDTDCGSGSPADPGTLSDHRQ